MKTNTLIFLITLGFSLLAEASDNVLDKVLEKLGASETVDVSKTIDWGILPGPFVNPEQGLGIGIAAVGSMRHQRGKRASIFNRDHHLLHVNFRFLRFRPSKSYLSQ